MSLQTSHLPVKHIQTHTSYLSHRKIQGTYNASNCIKVTALPLPVFYTEISAYKKQWKSINSENLIFT